MSKIKSNPNKHYVLFDHVNAFASGGQIFDNSTVAVLYASNLKEANFLANIIFSRKHLKILKSLRGVEKDIQVISIPKWIWDPNTMKVAKKLRSI